MTEALERLNALIDSGMEFPDAIWKVTQEFKVGCEDLTVEYDAQYS